MQWGPKHWLGLALLLLAPLGMLAQEPVKPGADRRSEDSALPAASETPAKRATAASVPDERAAAFRSLHRLRADDERTTKSFRAVKQGMNREQVRRLMGRDADRVSGDTWVYQLSPLANTWTERDIVHRITFADGAVSGTDTSYTCVVIQLRE